MKIIRELRKERNMTQQKLADETGVSLRTIQHYEKGDIDIPMKRLKKIARVLKVAPSDMIKDHVTNDVPAKYEIDTKKKVFDPEYAESIIRYVIANEEEFEKDETFRMWMENKAHVKMSELYREELQKLKNKE